MEFKIESFNELFEADLNDDFLEVINGPEDGKRFKISKDIITIGRLPENDFCIPLELSVSRKHARLIRKGTGYQVEVLLEAKNPGEVMGRPVFPGETAIIQSGNIFSLGNVTIELRAGKHARNQ